MQMKKWILAACFSCFLCHVYAQTDNKITIGIIDSINSKILNEPREIWVYVPNNGTKDVYAKVKYPVVYLLDGDAHFFSVVGMIHQLSSVNGNTICPEMIVVGIPNTDRTRDLTPTHVDAELRMPVDPNMLKTSGGGEQFIAFIEKELIPYIDSTYPTLPYKTLIGHSFGALTVMNTLINHKDLFNAYVAIDPSMWWDKRSLLHKAADVLPRENYQNKTLFLAIANTMSNGLDTSTVRRDSSAITEHIRSILYLNDLLQQNNKNGLSYDYKYYNSDNHGSVPLIATYDALHFIFNFYNYQLEDIDFMNFSMQTIEKIGKHYEEVSRHFGFVMTPPEMMINELGYFAMSQNKIPEAERLFTMNISNYPTSFNVYDSMGDLEVAKGKKEKAVEYFKKALSIRDNSATRDKLNALLKN